jgi:hypothetical protein
VVLAGSEPSGLGDPWLKYWEFQDTPKLRRSPLIEDPLASMDGGATWSPVWGSTGLVAALKLTPSNSQGLMISSEREFPEESKAGEGLGWYEPVTKPPASPGVIRVKV